MISWMFTGTLSLNVKTWQSRTVLAEDVNSTSEITGSISIPDIPISGSPNSHNLAALAFNSTIINLAASHPVHYYSYAGPYRPPLPFILGMTTLSALVAYFAMCICCCSSRDAIEKRAELRIGCDKTSECQKVERSVECAKTPPPVERRIRSDKTPDCLQEPRPSSIQYLTTPTHWSLSATGNYAMVSSAQGGPTHNSVQSALATTSYLQPAARGAAVVHNPIPSSLATTSFTPPATKSVPAKTTHGLPATVEGVISGYTSPGSFATSPATSYVPTPAESPRFPQGIQTFSMATPRDVLTTQKYSISTPRVPPLASLPLASLPEASMLRLNTESSPVRIRRARSASPHI